MRKKRRWQEMDKNETPLETLRVFYDASNRASGRSPGMALGRGRGSAVEDCAPTALR